MKTILIAIFLAYAIIVLVFFLEIDKLNKPIKKIEHFNTIQYILRELDNPTQLEKNSEYLRKKYEEIFVYLTELKNEIFDF